MSIKIWEAYRIPKGKLIEFTDILHDAMFNSVVEYCQILMSAIKPEALSEFIRSGGGLVPKDVDLDNEKLNKRARFEFVMHRAVEESPKMERSMFDFNCGFNVWFDKRYAYVIPIHEIWIKSPETPEWVEDFHYQNQVDPPYLIREGKITRRQWRARYKKWEQLCLGSSPNKNSHNARRFYHSVVDLTPPNHIHSQVELQFAICSPVETFKKFVD